MPGEITFEMSRVRTVIQGPGGRHRLADGIRELGGTRAMLVTGRSLGSDPLFDALVGELGPTCVGTFREIQAHNPVDVLVELISMSRDLGADVFVGVGGGSPIDAAKFAALGVLEGIDRSRALAEYAVQFEYPDKEWVKPLSGTPAPVVAIPTTLSAAEWDGFAGSVDHERGVKDVARYLEFDPCRGHPRPGDRGADAARPVGADRRPSTRPCHRDALRAQRPPVHVGAVHRGPRAPGTVPRAIGRTTHPTSRPRSSARAPPGCRSWASTTCRSAFRTRSAINWERSVSRTERPRASCSRTSCASSPPRRPTRSSASRGPRP